MPVDTTRNLKLDHFLTKSSMNTCRERLKLAGAARTKLQLETVLQTDKDSLDQLEDLLDHKLSYSLVDMSRLLPSNRRPNQDFSVMLK